MVITVARPRVHRSNRSIRVTSVKPYVSKPGADLNGAGLLKPVRVVNKKSPPTKRTHQQEVIIRNKTAQDNRKAVVENKRAAIEIPAGRKVVKVAGQQRRPVIIKKRERSRQEMRGKRVSPSVARTKFDSKITPHINKVKALHNKGNGRVLIIIACGPSVKEVPLEKLKNHAKIDILCVNKPEPRVWPSTYWSFCDNSQYNRNKETHRVYNGIVFNSPSIKVGHKNQIIIRNRRGMGFSKDMTVGYHIGRSTTYASLQIGYYLGYDRIYVFGLDMCKVSGSLWYYGDNPDVDNNTRVDRFAKEAEHYNYAANILTDEERSKFYICSSYNTWSFVDKFNHRDHLNVVSEILEFADGL